MTPTTYWLGWGAVAIGSLYSLYWVLRLAQRHERRREQLREIDRRRW